MIFSRAWWRFTARWLFTGGQAQDQESKNPIQSSLSTGSIRAATIALSLGVCALSLTFAVFSGFEKLLADRVVSENGDIRYEASQWHNYKILPQTLEEFPAHLKDIELFWTAPVMIVGAKAGRGVQAEVRRSFTELRQSSPSEKSTEFVSVKVSQSLADYLGVKVGEQFRIVIPGYLKKAIPVKLTKVQGLGLHHVDSRRIILSEKELSLYISQNHPEVFARRLGDFHGARFFLSDATLSKNPTSIRELSFQLEAFMSKITGDSLARLFAWHEEQRNFFGGIANDKRLVTLIMALLTIVASLNIATSLLVLFFERDRQIALMRALGLSRLDLILWVSIQGVCMGAVATIMGFLLSGFLSQVLPRLPFLKLPEDIYNVSSLPMTFHVEEQIGVVLFGIMSATTVAFILGCLLSRMSIVGVLGHRR